MSATTYTMQKPKPGSDAVGVKSGRRRGATWTQVHDWVTFSTVSPEAKALYAVMRAHIFRDSEEDVVWTSTLALALVLGYSRGDKIKKFMDELVELGAVTRDRIGVHGVNVYEVEQEPPANYRGPRSSNEWHQMNGPKLDELRAIEKAARDARRAKQKTEKPDSSSSAPVPPDRGEQASGSVHPDRGEHVHPDQGEVVHPVSGREPSLGLSVGSKGTVCTTTSIAHKTGSEVSEPVSAVNREDLEEERISSSKNLENQEEDQAEETKDDVLKPVILPELTDWEATLVQECLPLSVAGIRGWKYIDVRKVLGSRRVRAITAQNPELVRRAFRLAAEATHAEISLPIRLWHVDGCPMWRQAERQLAAESAPAELPEPQRSAPRQVAPVSAPPAQGKSSVAARDHQEYLEWKAAHAAKLAAKQAASVS